MSTVHIKRLLGATCLGLATLAPHAMAAADYPSRPIRLVVPFSPGGGSDIIGRAVGHTLSGLLGQTVVVDNKPGAAAVIGSDFVAKAAPDGYTLLLADSPHAINGSVLPRLPFDPVADFTPIGMIGRTPLVLVVHPGVQANDLAAFRTLAADGSLNLGSGGTGTLTHMVGALMQARLGVELTHVPFKGTGQAISNVVAGHVETMVSTTPGIVPHVASGALRALAVTGDAAEPALPGVPTFVEAGLDGFVEYTWYGLLAPAGVPAAVVDRLNEALQAALRDPDLLARLKTVAVEPQPGPAAVMADTIAADLSKWATLVREQGISVE